MTKKIYFTETFHLDKFEFWKYLFQMDTHNDSISTVAYSDDKVPLKFNTDFKISKDNFELAFSSSIETSNAEEMKIVSFTGLDKITQLVNKTVTSVNSLQVKEEK